MSRLPELRLENVYAAYDKADVLIDVSIRVPPGKITCILGSNGSGKTTLIRTILSLTKPRSGNGPRPSTYEDPAGMSGRNSSAF